MENVKYKIMYQRQVDKNIKSIWIFGEPSDPFSGEKYFPHRKHVLMLMPELTFGWLTQYRYCSLDII